MSSPASDRAVSDVLRYGNAILKFVSPNDVGLTGSHQSGFYLPKAAWQMFTPQKPEKGVNYDHPVTVVWQDGTITASVVKWYGRGTRSEYRLTRFGRSFQFIDHDCVGSLLVLVIRSRTEFIAYELDTEEDIEAVQAGLGLEVMGSWAVYDRDKGGIAETSDECLDRLFRLFTAALKSFPSTTALAQEARQAVERCVRDFMSRPSDDRLLACVDAEYRLFRMVERKLSEADVIRLFASIDDFLETAQRILQRRKSRAGSSLEKHVATILEESGVPYEVQQKVDGTKPDVLIPGRREYLDARYPEAKLFAIGVKTTCKDRWRQVLREAPRVRDKHILTMQQGISSSQLREMTDSGVKLIVPKPLHKHYPPADRESLLTVESFVKIVRNRLGS